MVRQRTVRREASKGWAAIYWGIAALMLVGGLVIFFVGKDAEHRTFVLEAYEIALLAAFWLLQTWDRRREGAPPRTQGEIEQRQEELASQA